MTLKSLYNIIIKIIGLLFIKDLLVAVPSLITLLFYGAFEDAPGRMLETVIPLILGISVYLLALFLLVFRTDMVIEKLKLAPEPDVEMIGFRMHRSTILMIAIIVIAGVILVENIPDFLTQLYNYFTRNDTGGLLNLNQPSSMSYFIIPGIKIFIAVVMIIYQREIINAIEVKRKNLPDNN